MHKFVSIFALQRFKSKTSQQSVDKKSGNPMLVNCSNFVHEAATRELTLRIPEQGIEWIIVEDHILTHFQKLRPTIAPHGV